MSSRALRRLQREQEQKKLASLQEPEDEDGSELETSPERPAKKINAFNLLEGAGGDADEDEDDDDRRDLERTADTIDSRTDDKKQNMPTNSSTAAKSKKKKKKGKKRAKEKAEATSLSETAGAATMDPDMDEIDRALRELSAKRPASNDPVAFDTHSDKATASWHKQMSKMLSVDSKNLNPLTEMKSLFGNVALENRDSPFNRPRGRGDLEHVDLGTALMGRYSPVSRGQELGSLAGRRNVFVQGKPEWPRATSGGLGMELNTENENGEKIYQIVHNAAYTATQHEFRVAVEMMQPERMIQLLQFNPYHIATLLQVSEIAKHQGDHSVSADLLERALFTFGRSVHSTFGVSLRDGLARLEFDIAENREIWLTIWRYMSNLGMRGTWRTAFEWAKVLLSLSPLKDPYSVTLFIDQLALRGRQHEQLIRFCEPEAFGYTWGHLPNIQISLSLAHHRAKNPTKARQVLAEATHKYPYLIARLFQELDLSPVPKAVWGSLPSTDAEKLYTELYVTRANDLWNTPETTSLLMEVAQSLESYDLSEIEPAPKLEISLEEARHVLLTEVPTLIALLPRRFTSMPTSGVDPLPPPASDGSGGFIPRAPGQQQGSSAENVRNALNVGAGWFSRLMEWFQGSGPALQGEEFEDALQQALGGEDDGIQQRVLDAFRSDTTTGSYDEPDDHQTNNDSEVAAYMAENDGLDQEVTHARHNAHAATVEEEDEEIIGQDVIDPLTDRALLRSRSPSPSPQPSTHETEISSQIQEPTTPTDITTQLTQSILNDPQRTQRWLLSSGTEPLQSFIASNGADTEQWPTSSSSRAVNEYYTAMMKLRATQRDWIINVLGQRDKGLATVVKDIMGSPRQIVDVP